MYTSLTGLSNYPPQARSPLPAEAYHEIILLRPFLNVTKRSASHITPFFLSEQDFFLFVVLFIFKAVKNLLKS